MLLISKNFKLNTIVIIPPKQTDPELYYLIELRVFSWSLFFQWTDTAVWSNTVVQFFLSENAEISIIHLHGWFTMKISRFANLPLSLPRFVLPCLAACLGVLLLLSSTAPYSTVPRRRLMPAPFFACYAVNEIPSESQDEWREYVPYLAPDETFSFSLLADQTFIEKQKLLQWVFFACFLLVVCEKNWTNECL